MDKALPHCRGRAYSFDFLRRLVVPLDFYNGSGVYARVAPIQNNSEVDTILNVIPATALAFRFAGVGDNMSCCVLRPVTFT
jgi:hypothetical protein